jgi:geranylgeranyl pyrophosphate synthase
MAGSFANGMGSMHRVEPRLAAALGDILARPGSMVRAVTAYQIGVGMGAPEESARAVACGIEYLHTASLVFDDLPAMDDARTRRGAPCPHVAHGEAVAMLAALALINRGYALIWQGIRRTSSSRRERAGDWVDARLGTRGVIGGQAYDLQGWRGEQSPAEVSEVAARKTGDLLRLTLVLPALIGHGTEREIQLLDRIGLLRGLAYQAADDLKDVLCTQGESGKTGGRDQEMGRPNLILAEGFQAALRRFKRVRQMGDRAQAALPGAPERWGMLAPLRVSLPTNTRMVPVEPVRAAS